MTWSNTSRACRGHSADRPRHERRDGPHRACRIGNEDILNFDRCPNLTYGAADPLNLVIRCPRVPMNPKAECSIPRSPYSPMPVKNIYHDAVVRALMADEWTITHDPLVLSYGGKDEWHF